MKRAPGLEKTEGPETRIIREPSREKSPAKSLKNGTLIKPDEWDKKTLRGFALIHSHQPLSKFQKEFGRASGHFGVFFGFYPRSRSWVEKFYFQGCAAFGPGPNGV
jgi:hypothetical protein